MPASSGLYGTDLTVIAISLALLALVSIGVLVALLVTIRREVRAIDRTVSQVTEQIQKITHGLATAVTVAGAMAGPFRAVVNAIGHREKRETPTPKKRITLVMKSKAQPPAPGSGKTHSG